MGLDEGGQGEVEPPPTIWFRIFAESRRRLLSMSPGLTYSGLKGDGNHGNMPGYERLAAQSPRRMEIVDFPTRTSESTVSEMGTHTPFLSRGGLSRGDAIDWLSENRTTFALDKSGVVHKVVHGRTGSPSQPWGTIGLDISATCFGTRHRMIWDRDEVCWRKSLVM